MITEQQPEGASASHAVDNAPAAQAMMPEAAPGEQPKAASPKKSTATRNTASRFTPGTILELIGHAYAEGGKRLILAADLSELEFDKGQAEAEMSQLRRLAENDRQLAVPPQILIAVARVKLKPATRGRILELVLAALAVSPAFLPYQKQLLDPGAEPRLDARNISEATKVVTYLSLGYSESKSFTPAHREQLRVNAVTAFTLLRVLRDGWSLEWLTESMTSLVWTAAARPGGHGAAVLASAPGASAMSQLARYFEGRVAAVTGRAEDAEGRAAFQARRAGLAEEQSQALSAELDAERQRAAQLASELDALRKALTAERSNRVVDQSHHVDDFETLRTRVLRQLSAQADLLADGLHALRHGSTGIAEEFVDRSLTAITKEVTQLREMDKYRQ